MTDSLASIAGSLMNKGRGLPFMPQFGVSGDARRECQCELTHVFLTQLHSADAPPRLARVALRPSTPLGELASATADGAPARRLRPRGGIDRAGGVFKGVVRA